MLKIAYFEVRQERVQSLGRAIGEFYFHKRQDFCASTGPFFLGWIAEALEVYVIISYQGGPAWLSLASLSPPSPFFHQKPRLLHSWLTLPRFYRHLHKGEHGEIGGAHASNSATSVYRGI